MADCRWYPGDPPRLEGPRANQGVYPWLAVWILHQRIQTGPGVYTGGTRSCVSLEPRRRGDCLSGAVAGEAESCTPPAGGVLHADRVSSAAWCTQGAHAPWVPQGYAGQAYPLAHCTS